MPLVGFVCPKTGQPVKFFQCLDECSSHCHPLPLLMALMPDRQATPGVYHVTEIFNPPKIAYMERHFDYYVSPESRVYVNFGSAYHTLMEQGYHQMESEGLGEGYEVEQGFRVEINTRSGKALLSGRPDLYIAKTKTLWDFKTEKAFSILKMKKGEWRGVKHPWQLNTYRLFKYPGAEHLKLSALVKDHSRQVQRKDGLSSIEIVDVPRIDDAVLMETIKANIAALLDAERDPSTLRDCLEEEMWANRIRCEEYCPCRDHCVQWRVWKEGHQHGHRR